MRRNTARPIPTVEWRSSARKTRHHALHDGPKGKGITALFHGGELTLAAFNRNNPFPAKDYAEMLRRRAPSS